jgi:GntR family transcriptional regulator
MDIVITNGNTIPIYEQIRRQITAQILSGQLPAGFCLPPIRVVAVEIGVSVITVKKAWELLEADGLIYTHTGKGCFVAMHREHALDDKRLELAAEQFKKDVVYYRDLGIKAEEMQNLVKQMLGK